MSAAVEETVPAIGRGLHHSPHECTYRLRGVQDALYVLNGKWKLPIIIAMSSGSKRFREIQRTVNGITAKVLSKELKELEMNEFVERRVYNTIPVTVEYELTQYSETLDEVVEALSQWGLQHRARIFGRDKAESS